MSNNSKRCTVAYMGSILITGGAGFIGVNAAEHFLQKNWDVTVLDNFSRRGTELNVRYLKERFGSRVLVVRGDVRSRKTTETLVEDHDVVLHLAAQVAVTSSVVEPWGDFKANALGTLRVLDAVRLSQRKPIFLFASTNKVYGSLENVPIVEGERRYALAESSRTGVSEEQQLDFHSPYGCSKGAADQYVRDYARLYGLKTVVFRQSCIYGPSQFGVEDQGWVAWFLVAALLGKPITIYGNGKQVRDLLHVADLLHAYDLAIENVATAAGKIYNIGGGPDNTFSLLEFLSFMERDLGLPVTWRFAPVRPGDQPIFVSDNSRIGRELGWSVSIPLRQGVAELHEWLRAHEQDIQAVYRSPTTRPHPFLHRLTSRFAKVRSALVG